MKEPGFSFTPALTPEPAYDTSAPMGDPSASLPRPAWIRARLPGGPVYRRVRRILEEHGLHTVCQSANCPNAGECWEQGMAAFMILGDQCTRACTFCNVAAGRPAAPDPDEPARVAEAAAVLKLDYVVVTSVTRDDLPDGGAGQFAAVIRALRARLPQASIEVLIPDFQGEREALESVFRERPDILNHNIETVPRLYLEVRPQANYERSLGVLALAHQAGLTAKSGLMLGLGEAALEIEDILRDLHARGVNIVTIGQYLRPSKDHHPIARYATPGEFAHWKAFGEALGIRRVEAAPLVRSSYHARESMMK